VIAERYEQWGHGNGGIKDKYIDRCRRSVPRCSDLLDLGCGTGAQVTQPLASEYRVVGVDISTRSIEIAKTQVPEAMFMVGDIASVSFPDKSFDAVVAFFSLIHVPREQHADVLTSIVSWLRPSGWFIGTMGAGIGEDTFGDFLGVDMYWSSWGTAKNLDLFRNAGLLIETATEETEDEGSELVTHLWIVAQRPSNARPGETFVEIHLAE
jgi:SAM-dependent methyltransferase